MNRLQFVSEMITAGKPKPGVGLLRILIVWAAVCLYACFKVVYPEPRGGESELCYEGGTCKDGLICNSRNECDKGE